MKEGIDPEDQKVLLPLLRAFVGWNQEELALHAGLDPSTVRRYEKGGPMKNKSFQQLVAGTGLPLSLVETCFLPAIRAGRASLTGAGSFPELPDVAVSGLDGALAEARHSAFTALLGELSGGSANGPTAEISWEARTWRFVERLCHESEAIASGDAERALKLAEFALRFAERAPGPAERRHKLESYAWTFVANARRVAGSLPSAETAFLRAEKAWIGWGDATPVDLASWRLPDGKASLRRHQGRFAEALELHDRALAIAPPDAAGRILLNKAFTFEQQGQALQALSTLEEAEQRIDAGRAPRLLFGIRFNGVVNLIHLSRFSEAARKLPEVRAMAEAGGLPLDQLRVLWLESRIAAGLGRRAEAVELLDRVRREFLAREIAYDAALASLELAVLHLEDGRSAEVRTIAAELAPIFAAQRVPRETLACVGLFCKAAQQETVTAELARGWLRELSRAG